MRPSLGKLTRFRPRIVTVIVFFAVAAMIVLSNLSAGGWVKVGDGDAGCMPYGWPLVWHRIVFHVSGLGYSVVGWYYSLTRLVANIVLWLMLLTALSSACEWLMRRYRPRLRWSLRTLLVFVALSAAISAWYANARNRAAIQDPLIVSMKGGYGIPLVFVERSGPNWLDLLGIDHLRRRIVLATYWSLDSAEPGNAREFIQLSRLPSVKYLIQFKVDKLTPTTAKSLGSMHQLHTLDIEFDHLTADVPAALAELRELRSLTIGQTEDTADEDYARCADECLAAIGNMSRLETLELTNLPLRGKSLACLAALPNLKSLEVDFWNGAWNGSDLGKPVAQDCLRAIATLPRLERLKLKDMRVSNESLVSFEGLENLNTLSLDGLVTNRRPMLSHLPPLGRLRALSLWGSRLDDDDVRRLSVLPRLVSLKIGQSSIYQDSLITSHGLTQLAKLSSLEELELTDDIESPETIEALAAVKQLKRLHLKHNSTGPGSRSGEVMLDDGETLTVRHVEEFRKALSKLRHANPDLVIDSAGMPVFWRNLGSDIPDYSDFESAPERAATWAPSGGMAWMTPQELADFEKIGGLASFYGATWPDREHKNLVTAEFDAADDKRSRHDR